MAISSEQLVVGVLASIFVAACMIFLVWHLIIRSEEDYLPMLIVMVLLMALYFAAAGKSIYNKMKEDHSKQQIKQILEE